MLENLFTGTMGVLEKSLSAASLRQRVMANNIANANTPGFKKSDVIFEDLLSQALNGGAGLQQMRTHERHLSKDAVSVAQVQPHIVTSSATAVRNDGNNVDIEAEMANIAQNNLYYNALAQQVSAKLNALKIAIKGGS